MRTSFRVVVVLVLAAGLALALRLYTRPRPVAVVVQPVDRGAVEATVANTRAGTVKACRRAQLAPLVGGRVAELPVKRGDRVERGDLLLSLWSEDIEARRDLAERQAAAAAARAEEACLAADLARRDADRADRLIADGIVDESSVDHARAERDRTLAACKASRATADEARAQVAAARADLAKTVLRAPFAGVVAERNAEIGEVVTPSPPGIPTPPAIDLIAEGCLYVVAPLDEMDAPRVRPGLTARVSLDAMPDRSFDGIVRQVAPYVLDREKQARTVDVEVDLTGDDTGALIPGYSADVEVLLDRHDDVLRVPTQAVIDGRKVLVLVDGSLREREFVAGISSWEYTEVVSGLDEGDLVTLSLDRDGVRAGARAEVDRT